MILRRSLHLPVAVTEGSLTEKVNKNGVRLWTAWSTRAPSPGSRSVLVAFSLAQNRSTKANNLARRFDLASENGIFVNTQQILAVEADPGFR